ncbi:tRNA dihydrouridine synthase DusB [Haploplasma modicum]|jgi:tRNA-dihydrouridine synthase B|uniref:tRNA dihydrouridine synthase DusB n=1 Tax=Haploplasma modicum TaxID=2150 RepID=UPI00214BCDDF|nr:tRNA dihydrouridine synthase DusB [Haploplasma modicum]MCR1808663.1 tRNA dihydrouridine synthase DusB [Haploplasma modicum]
MSFKIRDIKIENKVVLAPMAGVSNSPFRILARKYGAGLVFAEMVSDKGLLHNNDKTKKMLYMEDVEKPMIQQIFGSDLETMVKAAKYIDKNSNCDAIDINMGCPVPKVAIKNQAGSALMKDPDKIYEIVKAIVGSVSKPVTVKIRSGWDSNSVNAVLVAKKIEEAGASLITVHARTRAQGYSGEPDLDVIKAVKEAVNIPVIGNGNIIDGKSAIKMLEYTNCDAVMIGRAALGNPWIFREIDAYLNNKQVPERPTNTELYDLIVTHLSELKKFKGEKLATLEMRGHAPWYLKGLPNASEIRKELSKAGTSKEMIDILGNYLIK